MLAAIVMLAIIALIGLCVYGSTIVSDPVVMIEDGSDECEDCEKNILCMYCWGMIEQRCSCKDYSIRWCQCIDPQRSDVDLAGG